MNILVCDDQADYLNLIVKKVKECYHAEMELRIVTVSDRVRLLEVLRFRNYDLAFIEMKMCKNQGIAVAKTIRKRVPRCEIIFICDTYLDFHKSFEVKPMYYMLKPIDTKIFQQQIDKIIILNQKRDVSFLLNTRQGKKYIFKTSQIIYSQTYYSTLEIVTKYGKFESDGKNRSKLFYNLLPRHFLKINQSTLINMDEIEIATLHNVILKSGEIFNISTSRIMDCHRQYDEYLRNKNKVIL
ncbi:MAG: response regulator [Coprobacillus sp.]